MFKREHRPGNPLLLGNFWNLESAQILRNAGFKALGSSSAAISSDFGLNDGEKISFPTALSICTAAMQVFDGPISIDFEAGYSSSIGDIERGAHEIYQSGLSGLNIEDSRKDRTQLRAIVDQAAIIRRIKLVQDSYTTSAVLNARVDTYLTGENDLVETVKRARAYIDAGADCIFVPGLVNLEAISRLVQELQFFPVNIMLLPKCGLSVADLSSVGVARISFGNFFREAVISSSVNRAKRFLAGGDSRALFAQ
jgi:2-methylisocitrate lyase-like PEP mutase family enzyme